MIGHKTSALAAFVCSLIQATAMAAPSTKSLHTVAERSGFKQTGRYDEVIALCDAFQQAYPQAVRCFTFGTTPEGRPMKAMAISTSGALDAKTAQARGLPVVLAQGGIHAGEIDGKDAGFWRCATCCRARSAPACWTRPCWCSCRSSTSTATRTSAPGTAPTSAARRRWAAASPRRTYNLNRDYVKADSARNAGDAGADQPVGSAGDASTCTSPTAPSSSTTSRSPASRPIPATQALREAGNALKDGIVARLDRAGQQAGRLLSELRERRRSELRLRAWGRARRVFRRATSRCATGWRSWSRRIRGAPTRSACAAPTTPSWMRWN